MPRVVRMMAYVETICRAPTSPTLPARAANLRRDLTRVRSVPDEDTHGELPHRARPRGRLGPARHVGRAGLPPLRLQVYLSTARRSTCTASGLGAGHAYDGSPAQLVVVAVPPDHLGATVVASERLRRGGHSRRQHQGLPRPRPAAPAPTWAATSAATRWPVRALGAVDRVGDVFEGRPWAVTPDETLTRRRWPRSGPWWRSVAASRSCSPPRSTTSRWRVPPTCGT